MRVLDHDLPAEHAATKVVEAKGIARSAVRDVQHSDAGLADVELVAHTAHPQLQTAIAVDVHRELEQLRHRRQDDSCPARTPEVVPGAVPGAVLLAAHELLHHLVAQVEAEVSVHSAQEFRLVAAGALVAHRADRPTHVSCPRDGGAQVGWHAKLRLDE